MTKRPPEPASEDEIGLYGAAFEDFTAQRDALAKRLREEGSRADADRVRKLKKPSRAAWAVNQGVRSDPKAAKRLIDSGKRLEAAQQAALSGDGKAQLRKAMATHQEAVEEMLGAVEAGLGGDRLSPAIFDRVRETLRAVAGDEELAAELRDGRLTEDREAVGFGGSAPAAPSRPAKRRRGEPTGARRRDAQRALKRALRARETAERRVAEARKRLDRAEQALEAARDHHAEAEDERAERDAEVEAAEAELGKLEDG